MSNLILKSVNTEKTYKLQENNIYVFLFPRNIRKDAIKLEVEKQYSVKVDNVRTVVLPRKNKSFRGQVGTLSQYKKAYVKVAKGMKIDLDNGLKKE